MPDADRQAGRRTERGSLCLCRELAIAAGRALSDDGVPRLSRTHVGLHGIPHDLAPARDVAQSSRHPRTARAHPPRTAWLQRWRTASSGSCGTRAFRRARRRQARWHPAQPSARDRRHSSGHLRLQHHRERMACSALASEMAARTTAHGLRLEAEAARQIASASLRALRTGATEIESRAVRMGAVRLRTGCAEHTRAPSSVDFSGPRTERAV